ncbi:MAG: hypothetical protein KDL10_07190, partial [Kiritimatiellae bacterium]|nr:hypothetical protein [Kiritimatiellia bacterium]
MSIWFRQSNANSATMPVRFLVRDLLILMLFGLVTRSAFYQYRLETDPLFLWPTVDEATYLSDAQKFVQEGFRLDHLAVPFWQPPGYVFVLSLLLGVGLTLKGIIVVQQLLGILAAIVMYLLVRRIASGVEQPRIKPLWAGLFFLAMPLQLYYETTFLKPVWIVFLLILLFHFLSMRTATRTHFIAGVCLGLIGLFQTYYLLLGGWIAWWLRSERMHVAALLLGVTIAVAPVAVMNRVLGDSSTLISYNGGANFYIGNNEHWVDTYNLQPGWPWKRAMYKYAIERGTPALHGPATEALFLKEALEWMMLNPLDAVRGLLTKAAMSLSAGVLPRNQWIVWPVGFSVLHGTMFVGLVLWFFFRIRAIRSPSTGIFAAPFLIVLATSTLFFPSTRYLFPALPFLLLYAIADRVSV